MYSWLKEKESGVGQESRCLPAVLTESVKQRLLSSLFHPWKSSWAQKLDVVWCFFERLSNNNQAWHLHSASTFGVLQTLINQSLCFPEEQKTKTSLLVNEEIEKEELNAFPMAYRDPVSTEADELMRLCYPQQHPHLLAHAFFPL